MLRRRMSVRASRVWKGETVRLHFRDVPECAYALGFKPERVYALIRSGKRDRATGWALRRSYDTRNGRKVPERDGNE